jgi:hypothetical protein
MDFLNEPIVLGHMLAWTAAVLVGVVIGNSIGDYIAIRRGLRLPDYAERGRRLRETDAATANQQEAKKQELDETRELRDQISASFEQAGPSLRPLLGALAKYLGARAGTIEAEMSKG